MQHGNMEISLLCTILKSTVMSVMYTLTKYYLMSMMIYEVIDEKWFVVQSRKVVAKPLRDLRLPIDRQHHAR